MALAVAALLLLHAWLALSASREKSSTIDELAHLTAGLAYWQFNDYRLQPENGNLPQRWEALPAWISGRRLPGTDHPGWPIANVWGLGRDYFKAQGPALTDLLLHGRAMNLFWSIATGLLIWLWAHRLFGLAGAFTALGFFIFCPTFLAHGALATSDTCMAFFMLASVSAYWWHLEDFRFRTGLLSAGVLGLACVTKFSFVLLPFMFAPLVAWRVITRAGLPWRGRILSARGVRLGPLCFSLAGHVIFAWLIIWVFFGLRHDPAGAGLPALVRYHHPWESVQAGLGLKSAWVEPVRAARLLPDAFVYGLSFVLDMSQARGAFLNGAYSVTGWPQFFPYAFLIKTPLPLLLALPAGVAVAGWRWRRHPAALGPDLIQALPLLALFVIYWLFSLTSSLNIGHRHILPTYPVVFIFCGTLGWWAVRTRRRLLAGTAVTLLVATHATASFMVRPHYLAYFNQLVGGPSQGYRHLVDSSLDWGQDLPDLAAWLRAHPREKAYLSYFGTADPAQYGVRAIPLPTLPSDRLSRPWHAMQPGVYAISATMLSHVYSPLQGDWTLAFEQEYQKLRRLEPSLLSYAANPESRHLLEGAAGSEQWEELWDRYEQLRFARLCHYLRVRQPDGSAGYSILIYRLSAEETASAVGGSLAEWAQLIERAAVTQP